MNRMNGEWKFPGLVAFIALALGGFACSGAIMAHNEDTAAETAVTFAKTAFESMDFAAAYDSVAPESKANVTQEKFTSITRSMLPEGALTDITAYAFEPIPGQKAMFIYVSGAKGANTYYYRLTMLGTDTSGYKVGSVMGGPKEAPGSKLKQPLKKS